LTLTSRITLFSLLLGGCGGESKDACDTDCGEADTDTDADADADTDTDTDTDTDAVEDCSDGVDNDNDGLLDCEDGDCAGDAACVEAACDDGTDNDADGLTDCEDDDCWGNGCAVAMAKLNAANGLHVEIRYHYTQQYGSPGCNGSNSDMSMYFQNRQPEGLIRTMSVSGTTWNTCSWSADSSVFLPSSVYGFGNAVPVSRGGLYIAPGCPLATPDLLPQYLDFQYVGGNFDIFTGPNGSGPVWFDFTQYPQQYFSSSTAWNSPGSPCGTHHSQYSYGGTFLNVLPGQGYWTLDP